MCLSVCVDIFSQQHIQTVAAVRSVIISGSETAGSIGTGACVCVCVCLLR